MTKVITYGTYDLLHYGHIRLLERAKGLGDYLIVGVTADDFDKTRGKINVQQSLMERIEAVRSIGIADEIIVEEYEGQKIDDIRRLNVDIFTVGSDWVGKFDYLNEYCKVVYLDRTQGVSSSDIRTQKREIRMGLVGESTVLDKFAEESTYVNGVKITGICTQNLSYLSNALKQLPCVTPNFDELVEQVDALYIISHPDRHYDQIRNALKKGKHVLCESPIAMSFEQCRELFQLAKENNCVLIESIKTAYSTAYSRLLLLAKSGRIGRIVSVDATCTSLRKINFEDRNEMDITWNSLCAWGPTALLPIFQLLGIDYARKQIISCVAEEERKYDAFTKIDFIYPNAVASVKVGKGVKSEGELVVSGTQGYIYVPAPWWKTDYFEIRYENPEQNKRYFYQLDGEGIRYEIVAFIKSIETGKSNSYIDEQVSEAIVGIVEDFYNGTDVVKI
ncbi:Gfo/Idh/MocA family oxidoreductase [Clostridium sp. MSJ-11]|uniref:Gfo/Idh/MocA family oxidoreductase n=1 Tax=Clostridium mobile TaxID=2841512 RepID=A0ABS6EKM1_9CLOT|nr:Gfo/Idh/MocA family oxidoreductase [Clostridium mobile]MBU5485760.1 Gfo/Idh/MocA family oxidoreductase [Clostridium mobile]